MPRWLAPEQARTFAHLTTPSLALALDGVVGPDASPSEPIDALMAAGQTFAGLPAAMAVVKPAPDPALEVISLAVAVPFRRLGLVKRHPLLVGSCCCGSRLRPSAWGSRRCR